MSIYMICSDSSSSVLRISRWRRCFVDFSRHQATRWPGGFIQWWFPWGLNRHFWWFCESFTSEDFLGCRWWVMLGGCAGVKLLLGFLRIVRTGIPINQAAFRAVSRVEHCWNVWNWHMIFDTGRCHSNHSKQQKTMKNTVTVSDINLSPL